MTFKKTIRNSVFFKPFAARQTHRQERAWLASGCSTPPPSSVKRAIIAQYLCRYKLDTLIETGTYHGDTVDYFRGACARVISIELNPTFANDAQKRFRANSNVEILQGDSGKVLAKVIPTLKAPALFWLDGHYSGGDTARAEYDTPILQELEFIAAEPRHKHVILIDDARLFTGLDSYPPLAAIREFFHTRFPSYSVQVENDVIRCCPNL